MRPRILITDKIHDLAIDEARLFADVDPMFNLTKKELLEKIKDYDALIVRSGTIVTKEIIEKSNLKIIGRAGSGLDNIDLESAINKGIKIVNSPEASTISVAELVLGSLITLMRGIHHAHNSVCGGKWERNLFNGNELFGKTLGIVGFGRIGREVADRARAFGMDIKVYDTQITVEDVREANCMLSEFDDLLETSDVVSFHVPLTEETRNMLDEKRISEMKPSAIVINTARGGIINEKALYDALKTDKLRGAILDVFEDEPPENNLFQDLKNVVLTPHLGAYTDEAQINAGAVVVEKIRNFFRGK